MQDTKDASGLSRRTVVASAAWAVPAAVVASALPAYASSRTQTQVGILITPLPIGQAEPVIRFSLTTDGTANLNSPTSASFTIVVTNGDTKAYTINPTPGAATTPSSGVSIIDPASQSIAAGSSATFNTTLSITAADLGAGSAAATLTLTGWAKKKNLSVSVTYVSGSAAWNNGTLNAPIPNPVTYSG